MVVLEKSPSYRLAPLEMDKLDRQLRNCDPIRYAAYRTAAKLDAAREALRMRTVPFAVVSNVIQHHGLGSADANEVVLDWTEASEIVADIFFAASKTRNGCFAHDMDVEALTKAAVLLATKVFNQNGELIIFSRF